MAKLFTGLTTIAGLFVGYTVGGPLGAVVGMMAGATLGMILSNLTFDGTV